LYQGWIQDFKLGDALKKIAQSEGGAKIFGVIRVKNHDFTPKISYFFPMRVPPPRWIRPCVLLVNVPTLNKTFDFDFDLI
jgi:hypothetical protein